MGRINNNPSFNFVLFYPRFFMKDNGCYNNCCCSNSHS